MDDDQLLGRIHKLVEEEKRLRATASGHGLDDAGRDRLRRVEEGLDQAWDLLRQRRAREEFGRNPNAAHTRPAGEVESYLQ
jgi:hypothetical protein